MDKPVSSKFSAPLQPSAALSAVLGSSDPLSRSEVIKKLWEYIKFNNLQNKLDKRTIDADYKLFQVFGKAHVNMFEMSKLIGIHLTKI